jgi:hypothetical protein
MRAIWILACPLNIISCSDVCGSGEPAQAERLLKFNADVFFDESSGFGASAIRDVDAFEAMWEHQAETYDIGGVPKVDFATSQVVVVQWSCEGCPAEPSCAEVQTVTTLNDTTIFSVGGCGGGSPCDYTILASEVWRTDITHVDLCEYRQCGGK